MPLSQGRVAVGRAPDGGLQPVEDPASARASFCVDRRGTWLVVGEGVRGVHVNGRPVQHKAMLRAGDTVYLDGVEILLVGASPPVGPPLVGPSLVGATQVATVPSQDTPDPRIILRATTGPHHGRSFTLDTPRIVGSDAAADIRIESLASRHARLELQGGQVSLEMLADGSGVLVNGTPCRSAQLQPGDQVAFDAHNRFVLEAPTPVLGMKVDGELPEDWPPAEPPRPAPPPERMRVPWLLLAAALIAAALSALLLL